MISASTFSFFFQPLLMPNFLLQLSYFLPFFLLRRGGHRGRGAGVELRFIQNDEISLSLLQQLLLLLLLPPFLKLVVVVLSLSLLVSGAQRRLLQLELARVVLIEASLIVGGVINEDRVERKRRRERKV